MTIIKIHIGSHGLEHIFIACISSRTFQKDLNLNHTYLFWTLKLLTFTLHEATIDNILVEYRYYFTSHVCFLFVSQSRTNSANSCGVRGPLHWLHSSIVLIHRSRKDFNGNKFCLNRNSECKNWRKTRLWIILPAHVKPYYYWEQHSGEYFSLINHRLWKPVVSEPAETRLPLSCFTPVNFPAIISVLSTLNP